MQLQSMNSKELYLRLLTHVRPYWKAFAVSVVGMVIAALTQPAVPALFKPLLDESFVEKNTDNVIWLPLGLLAVFVLRAAASYLSEMTLAWVAGKLVLDLRELMFERLLTLPTPYYDQHASGTLISKVTYDVAQVTEASTNVLTIIVRDSMTIIGLLAWMFYLNWKLSLISFALAPVIIGIIWVINRRIRVLAKLTQKTFGDLTRILQEATEGHRVIKIFGGHRQEKRRFHKSANWVRRYLMKTRAIGAASGPVAQLCAVAALVVIVIVASKQAVAGTLSVGGFVSFLGAMGLLMTPIRRLVGVAERLQRGLAAAESVFGLLDTPPEPNSGVAVTAPLQGDIEFRDVTLQYATGNRPVVNKLSITLEPGTTVALVGHSGSGKSTVANLLPRFYEVDSGQILIDGQDIREMRLVDLRRNISFVSQEVVLFNDTVAANIGYGSVGQPERESIREVAAAANALEFIDRLPDGLDTEIGEKGVRLSGGQRQRIAIARALLKDAPILILDEATSALDTNSERKVKNALQSLRQGRTTLVIAHRLSTIEQAHRILVLEDGRVVESGTHEALLARHGVYSDLYRIQQSKSDGD